MSENAPTSPPRRRRGAWRYEIERRLAPHVDEAWAEAFVLELRLRDVPGDAIGDALAEVESHCVESGEGAAEAFGEPVAYARALELPTEPPSGPPLSPGATAAWTAQAVGLLVTTVGATALIDGEPIALTWGLAVVPVLAALTVLALSRRSDAALRLVVRRPVVAWLATMAHLGLLVALLLVLDGVLAHVSPGPALAVGAALLLGATVDLLRRAHTEQLPDDPVRAPFEDERAGRAKRLGTVLRYVPVLLAPAMAAVFAGLARLLG